MKHAKVGSLLATILCAAAMLTAAPTRAWAQADDEKNVTLKAGDPAPPLAVDKWVKGEAVKELETLTGEPAAVAKPWIDDAKARLAANNAGALLTGQAIARLAGSPGGTQ